MTSRGNRDGKEDLRQRRSKRHLMEAMISLMEERPFREISVVDICDRAMVHRTTFYAHFEDKEDLFRYVLDQMLAEASRTRAEAAGKALTMREAVMAEVSRALEYCRQHRQVYMAGLRSDGISPQLRIVEDVVAQAVSKLVAEEWPGFASGPNMIQVAGAFYGGGVVSLIRWWLENDMPIPEEELLAQLDRLLPAHKA